MHIKNLIAVGLSFTIAAPVIAGEPHDEFLQNLRGICGHSYLGKVVESNESDEVWRSSKVVIHAPACGQDDTSDIRIPLHVGEDKSRTWIISETKTGLKLEHDHRHKDGTPDAVSMYGGDTTASGTANAQSFPANDFSKTLFIKNGIEASAANTWTITVTPGDTLSYRLSRPGRVFQVDFDLTKPVG